MLRLQASRHQGSAGFKNRGKQCMANSVCALAMSLEIPPEKWAKNVMDDILTNGDQLYQDVNLKSNYWSSDDIPNIVNEFQVKKEEPLHGMLGKTETFVPFYSLENALSTIFSTDVSRCIFTMGNNVPAYTKAIVKYEKIYFFDPHSRDHDGISVSDGFATLTVHETLDHLVGFIGRLADSLFVNSNDVPFEIRKVHFLPNLDEICSDVDSEWSGFSDQSEADAVCRLYLANEKLTELKAMDVSYTSDVSSVALEVCSDVSQDSELDDSVLNNALKQMDTSVKFFHSFDENAFSNYFTDTRSNENENSFVKCSTPKVSHGKKSVNELNYHATLHVSENDVTYENEIDENEVGENVVVENEADVIVVVENEVEENFVVENEAEENVVVENEAEENVVVENEADVIVVENEAEENVVVENEADVIVVENETEENVVVDNEADVIVVENETEENVVVENEADVIVVENEAEENVVVENEAEEIVVVENEAEEIVVVENEAEEIVVVENETEENVVVENEVEENFVDVENGALQNEVYDSDDDIPLIRLVKSKGANSITKENVKTRTTATNVQSQSGIKRCRKRIKNVEEWKRNVMKRRRNEGKDYVTRKGNLKSARTMKTGCGLKCRFHCHENIENGERQKLFHNFWALGDINKQRNFILRFSKIKQTHQKKGMSERRKHSITYLFPVQNGETSKVVKVCKTFFLHTLSISDRYILTTNRLSQMGVCSDDNRGRHQNRPNRTSIEQAESVRGHIESFPTVESHYCRKDTKKEYLSPDLSVAKMHFLYKQICVEKDCNPVSISIYRRIFDNEYNLSFQKPKKDQCDLCVAYVNGNEEYKSKMQMEYDNHKLNKNLVRKAKEKDKASCKIDSSLTCACFDLQEILLTPKSFESSFFYKRRLNTFNFSIYDFENKDGFCYVWNESISNRGACEMASCVYSFIKQKALQGKKSFIFYSDNCSAQNKNKFLVTMYWYCLGTFNLRSITHKYLEKGHTQNENDSIHSTIESASKNIKVYTTPQWSAIIRISRREKPYHVKEMSLNDFFDFKSLACNLKNFETNTEGQKVTWNKIKSIRMTSEKPNCFFYKTVHNGVEIEVDLFKRLRSDPPDPCLLQLSQLRVDGVPVS